MNIADDSATESNSVSPPLPTKEACVEGIAEQSVKITDGSATKSDSMPLLNKGKGKAVEKKVEDKKPKQVKESIRNAIEAVQGKMTDGLDDDLGVLVKVMGRGWNKEAWVNKLSDQKIRCKHFNQIIDIESDD